MIELATSLLKFDSFQTIVYWFRHVFRVVIFIEEAYYQHEEPSFPQEYHEKKSIHNLFDG